MSVHGIIEWKVNRLSCDTRSCELSESFYSSFLFLICALLVRWRFMPWNLSQQVTEAECAEFQVELISILNVEKKRSRVWENSSVNLKPAAGPTSLSHSRIEWLFCYKAFFLLKYLLCITGGYEKTSFLSWALVLSCKSMSKKLPYTAPRPSRPQKSIVKIIKKNTHIRSSIYEHAGISHEELKYHACDAVQKQLQQ